MQIKFNRSGIRELMHDPKMELLLFGIGQDVQQEAEATAQDAQRGPGGTISGYAEAGFFVGIENSGNRPICIVSSRADSETAWAAHFYTTKRDGVGHLRRALYKFTRRGA